MRKEIEETTKELDALISSYLLTSYPHYAPVMLDGDFVSHCLGRAKNSGEDYFVSPVYTTVEKAEKSTFSVGAHDVIEMLDSTAAFKFWLPVLMTFLGRKMGSANHLLVAINHEDGKSYPPVTVLSVLKTIYQEHKLMGGADELERFISNICKKRRS